MKMMTRLPFPAPSRLLLVGAVLLALSGCASVGRYPVQAPDVAASYGRGDATLNAPADDPRSSLDTPGRDIRQDSWWTGFGDERLNRLVAQALAANSDLAAAGLAVQRSRLQAGLASNALWPQPSSSGVSGNASRATDQADDWRRSYSTGVSLGWEVDLWGRLRTQRDIARWEAEASEEDRQNTALLVISDTITQYWNLAYLNQSIATGQANLERLERTRDLVQARFDAGAVSRLEVRQALQNLQSQRSSQSALEQQRVEVRNALTVLLDGTPWPQQDEPQDLLGARSPGINEGLPAELLGRRPDLRAAELRLRNSLKTIKVTATQYYPALSLTGSLGSSATSLGDVLRNPVATLGAGLSLPFLNLQRAQLDTDIAGTSYQIAATNFRKTLYTALSEVDNALSAREQLARQVAASQASYDEAVEVERAQEVRYRVGATDLRTWLEAQQTRRDAELSLAHGLEQADAGGNGDVQALDLARHRDLDQAIAVLAGQAAQAIGLATQHQGNVALQVQLVQRRSGFAGQAVDPHALLLQVLQATRQVGHRHHRDQIGGTGRSLAHGRVHRGRLVLGDDHGSGACGSRRAQASAKVVRVLHFVQHQQQGLALGCGDQAFQLVLAVGAGGGIARGHALVAYRTADTVQRLAVHLAHVDALAAGVFLDLGQARVLRTGLDQHFADVLGVVLDGGGDGVDADDPLAVLAHAGGDRKGGGYGRASAGRALRRGPC